MRRFFVIAVAAALVGFLLVACGDDEEETPQAASPAATEVGVEGGPPPVSGEATVTDSGLQVIDIDDGSGEEVQVGDLVTVHYTGWLADGTKFDSSVDSGQPATFELRGGPGGVIQGWVEGVAGMKVGGKRRLIIPPDLAYGEGGAPPRIPPNAELTFDVELVAIQ